MIIASSYVLPAWMICVGRVQVLYSTVIFMLCECVASGHLVAAVSTQEEPASVITTDRVSATRVYHTNSVPPHTNVCPTYFFIFTPFCH